VAYHITISVPLDLLNSKIAGAVASAASTAAAGLTIDSWPSTPGSNKADNRLAKIDIKAASSTIGNLEVIVTVTNYDKPVTVHRAARQRGRDDRSLARQARLPASVRRRDSELRATVGAP